MRTFDPTVGVFPRTDDPAGSARRVLTPRRLAALVELGTILLAACGSVEKPAADAPAPPSEAPPVDAPPTDAPPIDAIDGPPAAPGVAAFATGRAFGDFREVDRLQFQLAVPPGDDRLLIVYVGISSDCELDDDVPTVSSVTYAGAPLTRITGITGTPFCPLTLTRLEQWHIVAPAVGTADVAITLTALTESPVHGGAISFTGIDQTNPVRAFNTGSGDDTSASVTVMSAAGDLVLSTIGQGDKITSPGSGQTAVFIQNTSDDFTLDNTAASTTIANGATTSMSWQFDNVDDVWQMIATSLRLR